MGRIHPPQHAENVSDVTEQLSSFLTIVQTLCLNTNTVSGVTKLRHEFEAEEAQLLPQYYDTQTVFNI